MAIQSVSIDPNAVALTDDQIVGKINTATVNITRASCVTAAARPIGTSEIVDTNIAAGAIKTKLVAEVDGNKLTTAALATAAGITNTQVVVTLAKANLDAMSPTTRGYIATAPVSGQFVVTAIERASDGKLKFDYDDVAKP